ncbi:hypothetical protein SAY86_030704 [Trapa natans]|uniref:WRKY domain-containing protein n=1 Tax=Trapa natans TaxID=22666 RepID=A0AAN7RIQ7_TRANT|nr:hypothetical protein SAY86_030704 [Trapa natans]
MVSEGEKKKMAIRELIEGWKAVMKLQDLLGDRGGPLLELAGKIMAKIKRSMEHSLCLLDLPCNNLHAYDFSSDNGIDEVSEGSCGSKKRPELSRVRRGYYKRRRNSSETWTTYTADIDDGQAWRKYGQKNILNSKFPRSYYRCTYKHDRDCNATKQVQKMEDGSGLFQTIYIGSHTCMTDSIEPPYPVVLEGRNDCIAIPSQVEEEPSCKINHVDTKTDLNNFSLRSLQAHSSLPGYGEEDAVQSEVELLAWTVLNDDNFINLSDIIHF